MKKRFNQTQTYGAFRFTWDLTKFVALWLAVLGVFALILLATN